MDAVDGHRHGNGQLEVVRRGGERQRHAARVVGAGAPAHGEGQHEHQHEVDEQRQRDAQHIERQGQHRARLEAEQHDDGQQQRHQRQRRDARHETGVVPVFADKAQQHPAREQAGDAGNAQVDEHAFGDLAHGDGDDRAAQAKQRRQHGQKQPGIDAVEQHLEEGVERDQRSGVFGRAARQVVPDDDHGDAARQPDEDQPGHVFGLVGKKDDGQHEHQHRAYDPVLQQRQPQHARVAPHGGQVFVAHLGKRRVHHQHQTDGDGDVGTADLVAADDGLDVRHQPAQGQAQRHGGEDPQREIAVEEREFAGELAHGGLAAGQRRESSVCRAAAPRDASGSASRRCRRSARVWRVCSKAARWPAAPPGALDGSA